VVTQNSNAARNPVPVRLGPGQARRWAIARLPP